MCGEIIFFNPERARALAGKEAADVERDNAKAIRLFDEALRLDCEAALNDGKGLVQRAETYLATGSDEPMRALKLYNISCKLGHPGL